MVEELEEREKQVFERENEKKFEGQEHDLEVEELETHERAFGQRSCMVLGYCLGHTDVPR